MNLASVIVPQAEAGSGSGVQGRIELAVTPAGWLGEGAPGNPPTPRVTLSGTNSSENHRPWTSPLPEASGRVAFVFGVGGSCGSRLWKLNVEMGVHSGAFPQPGLWGGEESDPHLLSGHCDACPSAALGVRGVCVESVPTTHPCPLLSQACLCLGGMGNGFSFLISSATPMKKRKRKRVLEKKNRRN